MLFLAEAGGITTGEKWIIVFTGLTALFTLGLAVIGYGAYRHTRTHEGAHTPIVAKAPLRGAENFFPGPNPGWDGYLKHMGTDGGRVFDMHLFNQSSVKQRLALPATETIRVLWPRFPAKETPYFPGESRVWFEPHSGGNAIFLLLKFRGEWPTENRRYLLYFSATTDSGHKVRRQ